MITPSSPSRSRRSRRLGILTSGILAAVAPALPAASFVWDDLVGVWSDGFNWQLDVAPVSAVTNDLFFGGTGGAGYVATNDIANPFLLNTLNLSSSATVAEMILGSALEFRADDTGAQI